jgi:signal transducing adaptor molecule
MTGPPFVFDPDATYPDPNMQAWAQYYAQGGTDPTGSVYFISVPGITPAATASVQPGAAEGEQQQQQQQATSTATSFSGTGSGSESASAVPSHIVTEGLQRQNSLPNPYGPGSATTNGGETVVGPVSAGPGGPGMAAHAPWDTTAAGAATRTSLPGQFAQMRVGEPSVGA